ncbi:type III polyketide synthase [bacterium]|nr:type III polyketide synthase [bacterium]
MSEFPVIASVSTAVPSTRVTQVDARDYAARFFEGKLRSLSRLLPVFEHADIDSRYLAIPKSWYEEEKTFLEKNNTYIEWATRLGAEAGQSALQKAGLQAKDVDHIMFISTTGLATPSIDARLINVMGLSPHVNRTPIWGLGCAGGAMGLSQAWHWLKGNPDKIVLMIVVELCSLTFHFHDYSKSNLIALALFADGAAGVVLGGKDSGLKGAEILDTRSTLWMDSLDVMGWNFHNEGMQVVFSKAIPGIVNKKARTNIEEFLKLKGKTLSDINEWIVHPGGLKVIEAYEDSLDLSKEALRHTRKVLKNYGNMSSATVLFVLEECLRSLDTAEQSENKLGLLTALGPGFSAENLLIRL